MSNGVFLLNLAQAAVAPGAGAASASQAGIPSGVGLSEVIAPYMGVFFVAFFAAIIITPVMRKLAVSNGIVDWPDLKRKRHLQPVAYLGGVAIFLGWFAGAVAGYLTPPHNLVLAAAAGDTATGAYGAVSGATSGVTSGGGGGLSYVRFPPYIILGAAAIVLTGLFDDVYGIRARVKIGGQLFAAAALASVRLSDTGHPVGVELTQACLGVLGMPGMPYWVVYCLGTLLIAVFVVGGCNALNLLDGLDGLAAGTTAISCLGFLVLVSLVAVRHIQAGDGGGLLSDPVRLVMCLAMLGALLGFLPYNFNPATIFMGDAGSLLLGYLSVTVMLLFADTQTNALLLVTACLIIFALPITDTSLAIFRRKMRGQAMFAPDNQHIHHLLRRRGLSVRQATLVLYLVAGGFAAIGCAMVIFELRWRYILAVFFVMYGFIMVMAYKYGDQQHFLEQQRAQAADAPPGPDGPPDATSDSAPPPLPEVPLEARPDRQDPAKRSAHAVSPPPS